MSESAFPWKDYDGQGDVCDVYSGMTLRDYFAAKAMQGMLANQHQFAADDQAMYARDAYVLADAMLKARQE